MKAVIAFIVTIGWGSILGLFPVSNILEALINGYAYIPKLEGMTKENAKRNLSSLGFKIKIEEKYQKDEKLNTVYRQSPVSEKKVIVKDTTVTLYVNSKVMPDVKGFTLDQATELLEDLGMIVNVKREHSNTIKKEHIISQSVKVGKKIKKKQEATLIVSDGIKVPNVVGKNAKDAKAKLKKYGLTVETEKGYDAEYEEGTVIAQREKDAFDITIILTINKPIKIVVPNLYNLGKDDAHAKLLTNGFLKKNISYKFEYSNDIVKGNVIRQSIKAGKKVDSKKAIVVFVSLGIKENNSNASTQENNNTKVPSNTTNPVPQKQPDTEKNSEGDIITDSGSDVIN